MRPLPTPIGSQPALELTQLFLRFEDGLYDSAIIAEIFKYALSVTQSQLYFFLSHFSPIFMNHLIAKHANDGNPMCIATQVIENCFGRRKGALPNERGWSPKTVPTENVIGVGNIELTPFVV